MLKAKKWPIVPLLFSLSAHFYATYNGLNMQENTELEVDAYLRRRYEGQISNIEIINKEDLDLVSVVYLNPFSNRIACLGIRSTRLHWVERPLI